MDVEDDVGSGVPSDDEGREIIWNSEDDSEDDPDYTPNAARGRTRRARRRAAGRGRGAAAAGSASQPEEGGNSADWDSEGILVDVRAFTGPTGPVPPPATAHPPHPIELFITDEIITMIVDATNLRAHAEQSVPGFPVMLNA